MLNILKNLSFDPNLVDIRLKEFKQLKEASWQEWFSELCFCLLTANSKAKSAIAIQQNLRPDGFLNLPETQIAETIKSYGHRFHNNKAKFIVLARKYKNIKDLTEPLSSICAREFLVKHIKGLGFKEASHFLRNTGRPDVAIIDRHILRFMLQKGLIQEIPSNLSKKNYLKLEEILKQAQIPLDYLDLAIWQHMTGQVLK
ncbi:MAG: N-glycosylase/DNA lyase [candidate division TM6 bacterium GW2011_GWF2_32_72]|nr:MAG: N-glycosylase/DNA lyase [candidate division TM6 bacterium GW2011_GWF2_32_72]